MQEERMQEERMQEERILEERIQKNGIQGLSIHDVRCNPGDSAFLLDDGETAILYDSGFGYTGFTVAEKIKAILGDRRLDYIFLTHSHYDHALGSAYILRIYPDTKVVADEYAAYIFTRESALEMMRTLDSKVAADNGVSDYEFLGAELRVDIPCKNHDVISAGGMDFEVISLPGHTKCSVGYYCRSLKLFLSTETLGVYDGERTIVPSYLVSYKTSMASVDEVLKLDIEYILAPHYGILSAEQTSFFLGNMKQANYETAQFILDLLKAGKTEEEIIEEYKKRFWHGYIYDIYPVDAVNLNTSITINLLRKELMHI